MHADVMLFIYVFLEIDECSKLSYDTEGNEDESILFTINLFDSLQLEMFIISESLFLTFLLSFRLNLSKLTIVPVNVISYSLLVFHD